MIKVRDIAHVRIQVPDLDRMETYLTDFGLTRSARTDKALYMRGSDPNHHCHISELGDEPGLIGAAFFADSADDLREIATSPDAGPVETIDEPGGGSRVVLTDPNGFKIEVVHGWEKVEPLPTRKLEWNTSNTRQRVGQPLRLDRGPSEVKRLGHVVTIVRDLRASEAWYKSHFGLLQSDAAYIDNPDQLITVFMRCDRGDQPADHHTFLVIQSMDGKPGLHHAAFEVHDANDVFLGHEYLKEKGYEHEGGIGRHILGSQIFDYWKGPWGFVTEHWTDGDLLDSSYKSDPVTMDQVLGVQWGNPLGPPEPPSAK